MTVSQSRYGGLAEVGRAPTKEPRKESARYGGFVASTGAIGAGGAIASRSKKYDKKASVSLANVKFTNERRKSNLNTLKNLNSEKAVHVKNNQRFAEWVAGPKTTDARFTAPGKPVLKVPKGSNRFTLEYAGAELTGRINSHNSKQAGVSARNRKLLDEVRSHKAAANEATKKAKYLRVGGKSVIGLGLAGIAGSLYANEAKRGSISQKRSNEPKPMSLAEARYRRVNGL